MVSDRVTVVRVAAVGVGAGATVVTGACAGSVTLCGEATIGAVDSVTGLDATGVGADACVVVEEVLCLIPEPNSLPLLPLSGAAPRALANGRAYSLATGLFGSTCTGESPDADAAVGSPRQPVAQTSVSMDRARTPRRIAGLW